MIGWGRKLEEIYRVVTEFTHVLARHGQRLQDLKEEQRAMRATLDQLLLQGKQKTDAPGLTTMLLEELDEEETEEMRQAEREWEELRKAWQLLYGEEVPDA